MLRSKSQAAVKALSVVKWDRYYASADKPLPDARESYRSMQLFLLCIKRPIGYVAIQAACADGYMDILSSRFAGNLNPKALINLCEDVIDVDSVLIRYANLQEIIKSACNWGAAGICVLDQGKWAETLLTDQQEVA